MNETPERIWAATNPSTVYMDGSSPLTTRDRPFRRAVEYIRADLVPDPAAIHAVAIAQALSEMALLRERYMRETADFVVAPEKEFDGAANRVRALSPDPSLVVVRREQLEALREALDALPAGEWETWTSCSFRRISRKGGGDGDVLHALNQRSDGHPDLSWTERECNAICTIVNTLHTLLGQPTGGEE